jgi:hypothetical protein
MTWFKWFAVGKQLVECTAELLVGQVCSFSFTWQGNTFTVNVKRG